MDVLKKPFPSYLHDLTLEELEVLFREHVEARRRRETDDPNGAETEEDGLLAGRLRMLMAYRPVATARYRSFHRSKSAPDTPSAVAPNAQPAAFDVSLPPHSIDLTVDGIPTECSPDLVRSYRDAIYDVDWLALGVDGQRETRRLNLDRPSALLEDIFKMTGCLSSAFVTAQNPHYLNGIKTDAERHQELVAEVHDRRFRALTGRGRDAEGNWPAEESLLVLDCSRDIAITLGRRFGQNAVLYSEADFVPRLLLLR